MRARLPVRWPQIVSPKQLTEKTPDIRACWRDRVCVSAFYEDRLRAACGVHTGEWVRPMLMARICGGTHVLLFIYSEATDLLHYIGRDGWIDQIAEQLWSAERRPELDYPGYRGAYRSLPARRAASDGQYWSVTEYIWKERKIVYVPDALSRPGEVWDCSAGQPLPNETFPSWDLFNPDVDKRVLLRSFVGAPLMPTGDWQAAEDGRPENTPIGAICFFSEIPNGLFWAAAMRSPALRARFGREAALTRLGMILAQFWPHPEHQVHTELPPVEQLLWAPGMGGLESVMGPLQAAITGEAKARQIFVPQEPDLQKYFPPSSCSEWWYHRGDVAANRDSVWDLTSHLADFMVSSSELKAVEAAEMGSFCRSLHASADWSGGHEGNIGPATVFPAGLDYTLTALCDRFYHLLTPQVELLNRNYVDILESFPFLDTNQHRSSGFHGQLHERYGADRAFACW